MIKKRCFLLFVLMLLTFSAAAELIKNGSFMTVKPDGTPADWNIQIWRKPDAVKWSLEKSVGDEPAKSLALKSSDVNGCIVAIQKLDLKPNTTYIYSFYCRGENVKADKSYDGGSVVIENNDRPLTSYSDDSQKAPNGTTEWKFCQRSFHTGALPPGSKSRIMLIMRKGTGKVWFDKISVKEKGAEPKKALQSIEMYPLEFQGNAQWFCRDFPQAVLLKYRSTVQEFPGYEAYLTFELPENIRFLGSNVLLGGGNNWKTDEFTITKISDKRQAVRIKLNKEFIRNACANGWNPWENYQRFYFKSLAPIGAKDPVTITLSNRNGKVIHQRKAVFNTIAPLTPSGYPVKRFDLCLARPWNCNTPEDISDSYIRFWNSIQHRPWIYEPHRVRTFPAAEVDKLVKNYRYSLLLWSTFMVPWLEPLNRDLESKQADMPPALGIDGKPCPVSIATWYLLSDPEGKIWGDNGYFANYAAKIRQRPYIKRIVMDYEPFSMNFDFSEKNRELFRQFAKLEKVPSTSLCIGPLRRKWYEFKIEQNRLLLKKFGEMMRKYLPDVEFFLCSDHCRPTGPVEWCSVDQLKSEPDVHGFQPMPYTAGLPFWEIIEYNSKLLKKNFSPMIDPSEHNQDLYARYSPSKIVQNILITAAFGCDGMAFWPHDIFDGRYLHSMRDGFAIVARVEDLYAQKAQPLDSYRAYCSNVLRLERSGDDGKKITINIPDRDRLLRSRFHGKPSDPVRVLTAFNFSDDDMIVTFELPDTADGSYRLTELRSGRVMLDHGKDFTAEKLRKGFLWKIPANESMVIRIEKSNGGKVAGTDQKELEKELESFRKLNASNSLQPCSKGNASVDWGVSEGDNQVVIMLKSGNTRLGIKPYEGYPVMWKADGGSDRLGTGKKRGMIGDLVLEPSETEKGSFQIVKFEITAKGEPKVTLSRRINEISVSGGIPNAHGGLTLKREITLTGNGNTCLIRHQLINTGKNVLKFEFRERNFPMLFAQPDKIEVDCGAAVIEPGIPTNNVLILSGSKRKFYHDWKVQYGSSAPVLKYSAKEGSLKRVMSISPGYKFDAVYIWGDQLNGKKGTVEPLAVPVTLKPGEALDGVSRFELK